MVIQRSVSTYLKSESRYLNIFSGEHGLPWPTTWRLKQLLFSKSWCHRIVLPKIQLLLHIKCWHSWATELIIRIAICQHCLCLWPETFKAASAQAKLTRGLLKLAAPKQILLCQWRLLATPCDIRRLSSRPNPSDSSETFVKRKFFKFHQYTFCVRQKCCIALLYKGAFVRADSEAIICISKPGNPVNFGLVRGFPSWADEY